jgi:hypothetical protein
MQILYALPSLSASGLTKRYWTKWLSLTTFRASVISTVASVQNYLKTRAIATRARDFIAVVAGILPVMCRTFQDRCL